MQNLEIFNKQQKNSFKKKIYTCLNGRLLYYQGYEHFCLNYLLFDENIDEEDIYTSDMSVEIWYEYEEKKCRYYPDIFIKSKNLIIEVKSEYTYSIDKERIKLKLRACKFDNYNIELRVYDGKGKLVKKIVDHEDLNNETDILIEEVMDGNENLKDKL